MKTIYLVSCVSRKASHACPASALYQSEWFRKARACVEARDATWFILSAKHGLLRPDEIVTPYERTLNKMSVHERRSWAAAVVNQLATVVTRGDRVVMLAGMRYREFVVPGLARLGARIEVPMEGLRIGEQLAWLGSHCVPTR